MTAIETEQWTIQKASEYYNIPYWSHGYFALNEKGNIMVRPDPDKPEVQFEILDICHKLKKDGMQMPTLLRFVDILKHRVESLCGAFNQAIEDYDYKGSYTVCYPIKVNQQRRVVDRLVETNSKSEKQQIGLEAGSKPELMAVLSRSEHSNSVIVCNGYKDREYLRAALIAQEMGHKVYVVIEKLTELDILLDEAKKMEITPCIGVRAKLASKGESKWQDSGGDHSKFGLSTSQIVQLVDKLKAQNQIGIFQLLHFHLGSQITSLFDIQNALKECARFYAELLRIDVPIKTVDVGGGLGVDYEGTQSQSHCSVNYSMVEYAENVVRAFQEISEIMEIPQPSIITESGRALTAHHAVLITNVIDSEQTTSHDIGVPEKKSNIILHNLWETYIEVTETDDNNKLAELYQVSDYLLTQTQEMFNFGVVSITERALAERIQRRLAFIVQKRLIAENQDHEETLENLHSKLATKFFANFSIFQSLPDAWAVNQIFPVLSLHGLDKEPTETAVIQDITCDSDGMLKQYVNEYSITPTIDLPPFHLDEEYLLGLFMVGAYQEILGDMHNLFGDTHTVDLELDDNNELQIVQIAQGSSVEELLDYVDFCSEELFESYRRQLKMTKIPDEKQQQYLDELREGIHGYTYLED
ncbi:MAG: arginine decarboxylase [Gammaproteobacteria bacterium CG22_combo_CG10-13_8_21_14_all_40_8]|nr:MAG: arginine decarboxylase [Gammaproteobacteria bacterium CG22_combo_CG10-13_8_21_14_all_40_8]